jgi:hypothetical protein
MSHQNLVALVALMMLIVLPSAGLCIREHNAPRWKLAIRTALLACFWIGWPLLVWI